MLLGLFVRFEVSGVLVWLRTSHVHWRLVRVCRLDADLRAVNHQLMTISVQKREARTENERLHRRFEETESKHEVGFVASLPCH